MQLKPGVQRQRNSGVAVPTNSSPGKGGGMEGHLDKTIHRTPARPSPLKGFSDFGFETPGALLRALFQRASGTLWGHKM